MPILKFMPTKERQPKAVSKKRSSAKTVAVAISITFLWAAAIVTAVTWHPHDRIYTAGIGLLVTISVAAYNTINRQHTISEAAATIAGKVETTVTKVVYPIAYEHGERNASEAHRPAQLRVVRIPDQPTRKSS